MERGVYFDAWFPRQHCYHPSLPARRLRMIDDLRDYHATVLVWSAMGGGSLALPYLEQEAFGPIDPRFRFYGFLNDSEFVNECHKYGIKVFGIVFEVQGWEFPAELNESGDAILALNELRGAGKPAWLGLREFSQNRYPNLWKPLEYYFPGGLVNSLGEKVTDLIEECCSRDIDGVPCHARWVECPDRAHQCYMMDRNNPVWREYLKAIIRIQIDAGVDGIQLDEAELPITSFQYGGCFCKDCMQGFRDYLLDLPSDDLPEPLRSVDLERFHYGAWLKDRGYDFKANREETPLFWEYLRFQQHAIKRYFSELADYARGYAFDQGKQILVSGNFFNLFDQYYPLEPSVDLIITEMRNTQYRQPDWYRYAAGFVRDKCVVVVENPYGGIVPELVEQLKVGRGYDRFRLSFYEAAALGASMTVPYGAWMGSVIQDSFHPPHELCAEIQSFLAENDRLFSSSTLAEIGVVYSVESNAQLVARRDLFADNRTNESGSLVVPFWETCETLTRAVQPYDVIFFPDGDLRADSISAESLSWYRVIILPDCRYLTRHQAQVLIQYLEKDGCLLVIGTAGLNLPTSEHQALMTHPKIIQLSAPNELVDRGLPDPQVQLEPHTDMAINIQLAGKSAAIHIIRYDYDSDLDRAPDLDQLTLQVRLPEEYEQLEVHAPGMTPESTLQVEGYLHRMIMHPVPLYCILELKKASHGENPA